MDNFIKTDEKVINIHGLGRVGRLGSAQDCVHIHHKTYEIQPQDL